MPSSPYYAGTVNPFVASEQPEQNVRQRFLSVVTISMALPGLFAIFLPLFVTPSIRLVAMGIVTFVCRGLLGTTAGIMLWRGNRRAYKLGIAFWSYMIVISLIAFCQLSMLGTITERIHFRMLAKSIGKLFWGSLALFILIRRLNRWPKAKPSK